MGVLDKLWIMSCLYLLCSALLFQPIFCRQAGLFQTDANDYKKWPSSHGLFPSHHIDGVEKWIPWHWHWHWHEGRKVTLELWHLPMRNKRACCLLLLLLRQLLARNVALLFRHEIKTHGLHLYCTVLYCTIDMTCSYPFFAIT
jgi:hypothetical protein